MIKFFKELYWDFKDEIGRFNIVNSFIKGIPGRPGFRVRNAYIPPFFAECGENINIHEGVLFRGVHKIKAGHSVEIGVANFIQATGGITLGNNVMLGPGVKIWSVNHKFENLEQPIHEQGYDYDEVVIGNGVWLGANVFVMPGAIIPEGCVVSAGSVVGKKKFPPYSILAGNPCRVLGSRKPKAE